MIEWIQIILLIITIITVIMMSGLILARIDQKIDELRILIEHIDKLTIEIQDNMKISSGQRIGALIETVYDMAFSNHENILQIRTNNKETADHSDEQLRAIHILLDNRLDASLEKIDKLRSELQILRGQRRGEPRPK